MKNDRAELIKQIHEVSDRNSIESETACGCIHQCLTHDIADFILAREQALRDEHKKVLERIQQEICYSDGKAYCNPVAVEEALSIITAELSRLERGGE